MTFVPLASINGGCVVNYVGPDDRNWVQAKGYRKKILLREDALNQNGTLVQIIEISPNTGVSEHYHKSCTEVFHVLDGSGYFEIDGNRYDLEVGDTLTCEPGEVHSTRNPGECPFTYIVFKTNFVENDLYWGSNPV